MKCIYVISVSRVSLIWRVRARKEEATQPELPALRQPLQLPLWLLQSSGQPRAIGSQPRFSRWCELIGWFDAAYLSPKRLNNSANGSDAAGMGDIFRVARNHIYGRFSSASRQTRWRYAAHKLRFSQIWEYFRAASRLVYAEVIIIKAKDLARVSYSSEILSA